MTRQASVIIVSAVVSFAIGGIAGYLFGNVSGRQVAREPMSAAPAGQENTFEAGWQAAQQRLKDTGFALAPTGEMAEINGLSGEITEVRDNRIYVKIHPLEPLADPNLDARVAEVSGDTKIYLLRQKDQAQYQKEIDAYNKESQKRLLEQQQSLGEGEMINPSSDNFPALPDIFISQEGTLADLKAGQSVSITAAEDIKNKKQFIATEIKVYPVLGDQSVSPSL